MDGSRSSVGTHITSGRVTITAPVTGKALEVDVQSANRS